MSTGIKIGTFSYVSNVVQEGIFLCGCFTSRTNVTVLFINPVWSSTNLLGCKPLPVSHAQTNMTASRNFPFNTRFENLRWRWSSFWILQSFPGNPVALLNVFSESLSNSPRFQKLSWNSMRAWICLALWTPVVCCRITDWKISPSQSFTSKLVHCRDPLRVLQQIFSQIFRAVHNSVG